MSILSKDELEVLSWYLIDDFGDGWGEPYEEIGEKIGADIWYGASKTVLCFPEYPGYVFKIPMRGEATCGLNRNDEYAIFEEDFHFKNAYSEDFKVDSVDDYCALEAAVFQAACKEKLQEFFAETAFLMELDETKIYISEFIDYEYDYVKTPVHISKESAAEASLIHDDYFCPMLSYRSLEVFCEQHGYEKTRDLMSFVYKYNIGDLTENNMRFNDENILFLTDYSDYRE